MNILEYVQRNVQQGKRCFVDFKTNTVRVGNKKIIKEGESEYDLSTPCDNPLDELQKLFALYKYSLPSAREERKRKGYFKALSMDDIPDEKLMLAEDRSLAKARLEVWFLCAKLNGTLKWNPEWGSFFWQSQEYPELIVLKDWFEKG